MKEMTETGASTGGEPRNAGFNTGRTPVKNK